MIIRVPAPALSRLRPALRLTDPARPVVGLQGRRVARAAARGRRAAPRQFPAPARLGRPGGPRRADPAPAGKAAEAPAGHPRHRPAVAPPPGHPQVDLPQPDRTAAGQRQDHRADRTARHREQQLGIPADPRRAAETRPPSRRVHHPPGPQGPEDPPGTATAHRHDLAEVPAHPGIDDARHRLLPRGLRGHLAPRLRLLRDRSRHPIPPRPGRDRAPGRSLDRAEGTESADGSG